MGLIYLYLCLYLEYGIRGKYSKHTLRKSSENVAFLQFVFDLFVTGKFIHIVENEDGFFSFT
jgi:hypothetical protein